MKAELKKTSKLAKFPAYKVRPPMYELKYAPVGRRIGRGYRRPVKIMSTLPILFLIGVFVFYPAFYTEFFPTPISDPPPAPIGLGPVYIA